MATAAEEGRNPSTPSFGVSPPLLVGRDEDVEAFVEALEEGPGSPYRATLFTGQRGSAVLLNALEDAALARGWVVLSETTRPGLAQEMTGTSLPAQLQAFPEAFESVISAGNASVAGWRGPDPGQSGRVPSGALAAALPHVSGRRCGPPRWGSAHHRGRSEYGRVG